MVNRKALRIGLVAQGGAGWMGGTEYIRNLAEALAAAGAVRPILFAPANGADEWRGVPVDVASVRPHLKLPLVDRLGWNNRYMAAAVRKHPVDFIYPLTYGNRENIGVSFPVRNALCGVRWAGWIPDFQHRHLPRFFTAHQSAFRDKGIAALLNEATTVVLSSQSAADDLRAFYPTYAGRVEVLRFATCPRGEWYEPLQSMDTPQAPDRFFLVCNQFWQHKNHLAIFGALALLAERGVRPRVLCTGALEDARDPSYVGVVRESLSRNNIGEQVQLLGLLPRRRQIELLRRCIAVIQPSLFEGWSTVVEDARVLGRPLLLSDIPVHREQAPPGARYFPPESVETLADLMQEAWESWPVGPDLQGEAAARAAANERLARVGEHFLEIAAP